MIYSVRHVTTFRYEPAVRESVMEIRMQPRSEGSQRCLSFHLDVSPGANVLQYRDFSGNIVHHFDVPGQHSEVRVVAESTVEVQETSVPRAADAGDWADLDAQLSTDDYWEMLLPSQFAQPTDRLLELSRELNWERRGNPLDLLIRLNEAIYNRFAYVPNSTKVDSPIDDALGTRQGVCQDFTHIMIALVRQLRIPCRYVSGYLFHNTEGSEKKDRSSDGATHAWVEALVPRLGWIGFDPTNNLLGCERHIKVAIGRDYADVPPTRGVYKGEAQSELGVAVTVSEADSAPLEVMSPSIVIRSRSLPVRASLRKESAQQQQQ